MKYIVKTINEGTDWAVCPAEDENDDWAMTLEDAREVAQRSSEGRGFLDFSNGPDSQRLHETPGEELAAIAFRALISDEHHTPFSYDLRMELSAEGFLPDDEAETTAFWDHPEAVKEYNRRLSLILHRIDVFALASLIEKGAKELAEESD